ncbi:hypothetical protein GH714_006453 [Hevea brasiliensis]|uniref:Uncharacterized protein n=1 Tax=Hevea brasiliensis TaxID=3981 RepID=A0A6A6M742_HEVBR|nr:hypothetical protein GH714_006453 [Hevea brasiliensis]
MGEAEVDELDLSGDSIMMTLILNVSLLGEEGSIDLKMIFAGKGILNFNANDGALSKGSRFAVLDSMKVDVDVDLMG